MSANLREGKQLLIVSDTGAYITDSGEIAIFEPALREMEYISNYMDKIQWILYLREGPPPNTHRPSVTNKIEVIPLKFSGGKTLGSKIDILRNLIGYFRIIHKHVRKFDLIHTRGPSMPALIAVLLSFFYKEKKLWNKYAGNWYQENPPRMYGLQIKLLKIAKHTKVTINGFPDPERAHIIPLENPCFSDGELAEAATAVAKKKYGGPYKVLFVGRIEHEKGVFKIIEALSAYPDHSIFENVFFVGKGKDIAEAKEMAKNSPVTCTFLGAMNRESLNEYYKQAHFLLLPSQSEGFPKVLAEAAAFGCVPIVSSITAIEKYVTNINGFMWPYHTITFKDYFQSLPFGKEHELKEKAAEAVKIAQPFTYSSYWKKVNQQVL